MSSDLLTLLLERKIEINEFSLWISGKSIENIDSRISRSGFSLFVLNFIQQQTSNLLSASSGDKQVDLTLKNETTVNNKVTSSSSSSYQKNQTTNIINNNDFQNKNCKSPLGNKIHYNQQRAINGVEYVFPGSHEMHTNYYQMPLSPVLMPVVFPVVPVTPKNTDIRTVSSNNYQIRTLNSPGSFYNQYSNHPNFLQKTSLTKSKKSPSKSNPSFGDFMPKVIQRTPVTTLKERPLPHKGHRAVRSHLFSESSESSVETYQLSPKSPMYDQSFPDLSSAKSTNHRRSHHSILKSSNTVTPSSLDSSKNFNPLNSPESFPTAISPKKIKPFKEHNKQKQNSRRVNPTPVKVNSEEGDNEDEDMKKKQYLNKFGIAIRTMPPETSPFQQCATVEPRKNYDEERLILKQKRSEPLSMGNNQPVAAVPNAPIMSFISPDPNKVTCYDQIVCLGHIYSVLLDFNLVPNVTAEIHFIFSLLTVQVKRKASEGITKETEKQFIEGENNNLKISNVQLEKNESDINVSNEKTISEEYQHTTSDVEVLNDQDIKLSSVITCYQNILDNIHNCVLFAVVVITKQMHVINQLDRITLKLLADNDRLNLYASTFASNLNMLYQKKDVLTKEPILQRTGQMADATVKFELDTDNRDNFINSSSFSHFRKQRDIFYDILHGWRTKFMEPKPDRISQLLALSNDPINMAHLAHLVCCQLVSDTVNKTNETSEPADDSLLPGVTKNKLSMLEARLKNPQGRDKASPRPLSKFPDNQHFYKLFFEVASENSCFREHIINCFITRILELESTTFELDESYSRREEIILEFRQTIVLSCLLAKFLGLVVFLPYRKYTSLPENIIEAQISIRQKTQPPIDLTVSLQKSVQQGSITQTVPWVVEYLGMMDCVSPFLPCYRTSLQILIGIYRSVSPYYFYKLDLTPKKKVICESDVISTNTSIVDNGNRILEDQQQMSCISALLLRLCLGWLFDSSVFPEDLFFSLVGVSSDILPNEERRLNGLDSLDLVDDKFIFECCPYFLQVKLLLMANVSVRGGSVRHITPVPAQISVASDSIVATNLELQLEDNFLSNQVASVRSTLDFIKERVASACIKHICSNVIVKAKKETLKKINSSFVTKDQKKKEIISLSITELKEEIDSTISGFCETRIRSSLEALLGPDSLGSQTVNICLKIATRRCKEKIVDWLNSHINLKDIFTKLSGHDTVVQEQHTDITVTKEQSKDDSSINADEDQIKDSNLIYQFDESGSPIEVIFNIRDFICDVIEGEVSVLHEEKVIDIVKRAKGLDVMHCSQFIIMSVDLSIVLVAYQPQLLTQAVMSEIGELWKNIRLAKQDTENPLQRLLCPRNILLFCQVNPTAAWGALTTLIVYILRNDFLTLEQFEVQCVAIFRQTWSPAILKLISSCIKLTLEIVKQESVYQNNAKVMLMLELISETSRDIEEGL